MRLSLQTSDTQPVTKAASDSTAPAFLDADFVKQLLGSADVDPNDPMIQAALAQMNLEKKDEDGADAKRRKKDDDESTGDRK
jgi:hypothetical protein